MRQEHLDGLIAFVTVAERKGFSAAASKLGISASAVSQSIRNIEARLGAPLFARTTRSVSLTPAGERYLARVLPAIREITEASEQVVDASAALPSGQLRLTVARAGYLFALRPILRTFLEAYPQIDLEVSVDPALVDVVRRGFDAGIRYGDTVENDMVGVRVGPPLASYVVASPAYLERRGVPRHPRDLAAHECIRYRYASTGRFARWLFERNGKKLELTVTGRLLIDDDTSMAEAALDGIGIAYVTSGYVARHIEEGTLVRLLPEWSPPMPSLTLFYPNGRGVSRALRALIDTLRAAEGADSTKKPRRRRPGRRGAG